MKLKALIGDKEFIVDNEILSNLDIIKTNDDEYHVIHERKTFNIRILSIDHSSKLVKVEVNGSIHDVKLHDELDNSIQKMGFKLASDKVDNIVVAPMPGLILDVLVEKGQEVEKGQALLILEAMKMENVLKAEKDGVIRHISVQKGAAVEKKAVLIEMEL
ncbi:MAG: biotin carboxyl carrier protein [Saprospiraceae bacterium]|jgi:biotin carboxyl carrier protein